LKSPRACTLVALGAACFGADFTRAQGEEDELARLRAEQVLLLQRIEELERILAEEQDERETREREWLAWMQLLDSVKLERVPDPPAFVLELMRAARSEASDRYARARSRSVEMQVQLNALLLAEQVLDIDILEVGTLNFDVPREEGLEPLRIGDEDLASGWLGPMVVRLLDSRGRPTGTISAEKLRLECSRSGYGVDLVFVDGRESRGGVSRPFGPPLSEDGMHGGVRRIRLAGIDPRPWIEAFPELFDAQDRREIPDDGRWNRLEVRMEINRRLAADPLGARFRLLDLGGVQDGVMHGVQVVELDAEGSVARRLFADRMRIVNDAGAVQLLLEGGAQDRAGSRAPFLDGRYRIYLGAVEDEAWSGARLPGLSPASGSPPRSESPLEHVDSRAKRP
jgi:hypothetical protein